jgi:8-oxo-dGTP pyrophosphatase MutT (NUDIX family)
LLGLYNLLFLPQGEDICVAAVREAKEETGVSNLFVVTIECCGLTSNWQFDQLRRKKNHCVSKPNSSKFFQFSGRHRICGNISIQVMYHFVLGKEVPMVEYGELLFLLGNVKTC